MSNPPSIYPFLQYADAPAAIAWLETAFGFRTVMSHPDGKGGIAHAELQLGQGMVMLGSRQTEGPIRPAPRRSRPAAPRRAFTWW
jgi:uncharacterized glyoxalase superfamily protein PhnB